MSGSRRSARSITSFFCAAALCAACGGGGTGDSTPTTPVNSSDLTACRLPARFTSVGLGFPRVANRLRATGDVHMKVLFVDFPDAVASRTPQSAFAIISPAAETYYKTVSYGRMNLILDPSFKWLRMSKPSSAYGWDTLTFAAHKAYIQEALTLAGAGLDFSTSDGLAIISNPDAGALTNGPTFVAPVGGGVTAAGGKTFENAVTSGRDLLFWGSYWLNHEGGHSMGLADLYSFTGATHRFVGGFSLMGLISGPAREYFAWERWLLGWVTDDQVVCAQPGTTTATLAPVERVGGTKLVVVPTGPTSAVVVESRRIEGYDANGFSPGVLAYFIDTSINSGTGVVRVLPINDADVSKATAPLAVGATLTYGTITVKYVSQDGAGDHVEVRR